MREAVSATLALFAILLTICGLVAAAINIQWFIPAIFFGLVASLIIWILVQVWLALYGSFKDRNGNS